MNYKSALFRSISIFIGLLVGFTLCEVFLRMIDAGYGSAPLNPDPIFHHVHPRNYRFISHTPSGEYGGHEVFYDAEGLSADPHSRKRPDGNCLIAFLGDSFTEASQVPTSRSFVGLLSSSTSCDVKNYGTSSYSPIFYLLQYNVLISRLKPRLVIMQLFDNDMADDESYYRMAKLDSMDNVLAIPGPENNGITQLMRSFYTTRSLRKIYLQLEWAAENAGKPKNVVGGFVEEDPDISALSGKFVRQLRERVEQDGGEFAMMVVPSKFRLLNGSPNDAQLQFSDKWRNWASENHVKFIDLVGPFDVAAKSGKKLFFDTDIHFTEQGHAIVARIVRERCPQVFLQLDPD